MRETGITLGSHKLKINLLFNRYVSNKPLNSRVTFVRLGRQTRAGELRVLEIGSCQASQAVRSGHLFCFRDHS